MFVLNALAAVALVIGPSATDTTLAVHTGTRLSLENYLGDVSLDAWPRDAVRVRATHRHNTTIEIASTPGRLELSAESQWGPSGTVHWHITVPAWMAASVEGVGSDIRAEGIQGELKLETVKGDVAVTRCGSTTASSVEGAVLVADCRGRIEASSVNDAVRVERCDGELQIESVNGNVIIQDCVSPGIEASSVNGSVLSAGPFRDGGSYAFSTHDGDVVIGLPEKASVSVTASTYGGALSSDFPLEFSEKRKGREYRFTLGSGAASLELESFQGKIQLLRLESWARSLKTFETASHDKREHDGDEDTGDKDKDREKDKDKDKDDSGEDK